MRGRLKMEAKPEGAEHIEYLGDSVYVGTTSGMLILWTSNGIQVQNLIYLEPAVIKAFEEWLERRRKDE